MVSLIWDIWTRVDLDVIPEAVADMAQSSGESSWPETEMGSHDNNADN